MRRFAFLICSERSGSNLVTSLVDAHPRACGPSPTHLFRLFGTNAGNYGDLGDDRAWAALLDDVSDAFSNKLGRWDTTTTASDLRSACSRRTVAEPLRVLYEREAECRGSELVFVKENHTYRFVAFLEEHFPGCRFVWMVRDPRDVAASWVSTEAIPGGVKRAVDVWTADQAGTMELERALTGSGRLLRLRYEDLVADPAAALARLTDHLGLTYTEQMLAAHRAEHVRANAARIDAWSNLAQPIMTDNVGKHRRALSEADVRYVELRCGSLMQALGYEPSTLTTLPAPEAVTRELKTLEPRISQGGYRIPTEDERRIRARRLAIIDRVLTRRPPGRIPFNRPTVTGAEREYVEDVFSRRKFAGAGTYSAKCNAWLSHRLGAADALVTTSGTHALEMAALLTGVGPGDEVVLASYGFTSAATAFVRCGASLVFVDVDPRTMNIDPRAVERALTPRTKIIVALHYAGVPCDMAALEAVARDRGLTIVEDAAHAILSTFEGRAAGTIGTFGCLSFHESKNLQCGEGGALLLNDPSYLARAEILMEKGTDRSRFFRGEVEKYRWQDTGSSYVLGDLQAAFLFAQLEHGDRITHDRVRTWNAYRQALAPLVEAGQIEVARVRETCRPNGHMFWLKTRTPSTREALAAFLAARGIQALTHYEPLHTSPAGARFGRFHGEDRHTTDGARRLLRLPMFFGFNEPERVAEATIEFLHSAPGRKS